MADLSDEAPDSVETREALPTDIIADGTVRVRSLDNGQEWDELVTVYERDLQDTDGSTLTVEDAARRVAKNQCSFHLVETLECDLS